MKKEQLAKRVPKKGLPKKKNTSDKQVKGNSYYDLFGLAIIILLGIIIYSNSFTCSFQFDDYTNIVNNTRIRDLANVKAWWNAYPTRPVGVFTFVLNYHFNQLDVWYYHLVNLIIHLINACLVWWLTLLIFSLPAMKAQPIIKHKKVLAFFTAMLFVSHPLATQSVTYIVQREASIIAMFYFLSLALYVKARVTNKGNVTKYLLFAGSLISAVLAIFTKENSFTLPFAVLLIEIFFLQTKKLSINFKDYRVLLLIAVFLSIIIILPLKFSFNVFRPIPPYQGNSYTVTSLNYLFTQFSVIVKYIQLLFLPINQNFDYDFPLSYNFFGIRTMLSFLGLALLIVLGIILFKRFRIVSFGIFWFFLTLSVESSIIPIPNVIFEHRTYLPSFGFFLIVSTCIFGYLWDKYKGMSLVIMVIMVISYSYLTYERNKVWKDNLTFWNDVISKSPDKARPYVNRSTTYGRLNQWDKVIADCSKAIAINPNYVTAISDRGLAYGHLGLWDKAIADCSRAIELNPKYIDAYSNRSAVYGNLGQWDKVVPDCSKAIALDPKYVTAYFNRAVAYVNLGQLDKAVADYSKAIELDPKDADSYFYRGVTYSNLSQWEKAIADYSKVLELDPNYKNAYTNREIAIRKLNQGAR